MRHLIDPLDFTREETDALLDLACRIRQDPAAYRDAAARKRLATLFYEPSTRTRLSFEAAMLNLGGQVLGFPSDNVSSASKGESVADTIRVVSCYADIAAIRHPKEGAPLRASRYSRIPVINAGDGGHQHPTQTLTDLMTIRTRKGTLEGLTIGLCGDLKFGRTVHSLIKTMVRYKGVRFVLISPEELRVPDYIITDVLEGSDIPYAETRSLEESMPGLDILYMTPRPAGALFQRGGLHPVEKQLHPHPRKDGPGQARHGGAASPAPRQRDRPGRGRRPPRGLLRAGAERRLCPHGPHHDPAGPARPQSPQGGSLIC